MAELIPMRRARYRTYMLGLLTAVLGFKLMDQPMFGLLTQAIQTDLGLNDSQMGILYGSAFALFYATFAIPIAFWADRGNRVQITAITLGLWTCFIMCCGLAGTYLQMFLARVGVAVGEAGSIPPAQSLIAEYYSREERPKAMSIYLLAGPLSVILGYGGAGWVAEHYGWRAAFLVLAVPGVVLTLLVSLTLHEPRKIKSGSGPAPPSGTRSNYIQVFKELWRRRTYRHLIISYTVLIFFVNGLSLWTPVFLIRTHHIGTAELGLWYTIVWGGAGLLGTFLGGYCARRWAARREQLQLRGMAFCLALFVPLNLGVFLFSEKYMIFAAMALSAIAYQMIFGPLFAVVHSVTASSMRAVAVAIMLFASKLIGTSLGPLLVGIASDALRASYGTDSLRTALLILSPGVLWASFHLIRAGRYVQSDVAALSDADTVGA